MQKKKPNVFKCIAKKKTASRAEEWGKIIHKMTHSFSYWIHIQITQHKTVCVCVMISFAFI